jgi:hypothetical protein
MIRRDHCFCYVFHIAIACPISTAAENYPKIRFTPWNAVCSDARSYAAVLGYGNNSWDKVGSASIEDLSFKTINENDPDLRDAILALDMGEGTWDCYLNHYIGYSWNELQRHGLEGAFMELGWTHSSWEGAESAPKSENMYWSDLTSYQQRAAATICYFEELWDRLPLTDWTGNTGSSGPDPPSLDLHQLRNDLQNLNQHLVLKHRQNGCDSPRR